MKNVLALSFYLLAFGSHASTPPTPTQTPAPSRSVSYRCDPGFASTQAQPDCSYRQKQRTTALVLHCLPPLMGFGQLYLENYLIGLTQMVFTSLSLYMVAGMCRIGDGEEMGFLPAQTHRRLSGGLGPLWLLMVVGNLASLGWWIAQAVFIGGGIWTRDGYLPYTDGNGVPIMGY